MKLDLWLANGLLILHAIVVGITVAGAVALFAGRFAKFHKKDYFVWAFILCAFGQIFSLLTTGGCIFTEWERTFRSKADSTSTYSSTFLQEYLPFLPEGIIRATPIITIGALVGAFIQISYVIKRKKKLNGR